MFAKPHMMRSAPEAIACRPDAQNRFIVTADASTGTPARRLAMRATFRPCSASGIAQPRITSSTSRGSTPGARRSASPMTAAAISSGRTVLQRAVRRLADGGARGGNDYSVLHEKSTSSSSSASPTSLACPSNRWLARSISTSSFGSCSRA